MNRKSVSMRALFMTLLIAAVCQAQSATEVSKETLRAEVEQCVAQHESARQLRLREEWADARAAMVSCADERCPLAIAADCRAWSDEVARLMPTLIVVVEAERPDTRPAAIHIELDGKRVELSDPPSPIELLPGSHRLRLEEPGAAPVERDFNLQKGEKNHIERIRLVRPIAITPLVPIPDRIATRPIPPATYWLSASALAAFASSAIFLVAGLNEQSNARDICAPTCDRSISNSIQARLVIADISAGAGLLLSSLALYTYARRPTVLGPAPAAGPIMSASGQGISLTWRGHF